MKYILYIFISISMVLLSSCSVESDQQSLDVNPNPNNDCQPFVESSLTLGDDFIFPVDPGTSIVGHRQEGTCLVLDTRFDGGCEEHQLQLIIDINSTASINVSTIFPARLSHNNTDQCEALIALEVYIDFSALAELEYEVILLSIQDYDAIVELIF